MTQKHSRKAEAKNLPSGLQAQGTHEIDDDTELDEVAEEAYRDVGHIPDRDQMFGSDRQRIPGAEAMEPRYRWSGDMEDEVKGARDSAKDAVEELHDAEKIVDYGSENEGLGDLPEGKPVPPRMAIPRASGPTKSAS